jgi:putative restriction endonuclease
MIFLRTWYSEWVLCGAIVVSMQHVNSLYENCWITGKKLELNLVEVLLGELLSKYGLRSTRSLNPQYPFVYLASSRNIWLCSVDKQSLAHPDAASRAEVLGSTGRFTEGFLAFLSRGSNAEDLIRYILNSYWPESYHQDILSDIWVVLQAGATGSAAVSGDRSRGRRFVEEVLDAYERKCAVCFQSIRLGDALVGIDACHLKPLQHFGSDDISNGLALCKVHHWALDRGAFSFDAEFRVMVSPKLNGVRMEDVFTSFERRQIFVPRRAEKRLSLENVEYHNQNIFFR